MLDAAGEAGADQAAHELGSAHALEVAATGLTVTVVSDVHTPVGSTVTVVYVVDVATVEVVPTSPPRSY